MKKTVSFYKEWSPMIHGALVFLLIGAFFLFGVPAGHPEFMMPFSDSPDSRLVDLRYIALGIAVLGALLSLSPIFILEPLIKSDIEDLKAGRIWSPTGYENISHIPEEERMKRYVKGTLLKNK